MPYRGNGLNFALDGIDIKDAKEKFDATVRSSYYIADLIAVCPVQPYHFIAADFLKVSRHLGSALAGLVGVVRRIGYSRAEAWTTGARVFRTWVGA